MVFFWDKKNRTKDKQVKRLAELNTMWHVIANFILRFRIFLVSAIFLITIGMGFLSQELRPSLEFKPPLAMTDPAVVDYLEFLDEFQSEAQIFVLAFDDAKIRDYETYRHWKKMVDEIEALEGVKNVLSFDKIQELKHNKEQKVFEFDNPFDHIQNQAELDSLFIHLKTLPFYRDIVFKDNSNIFATAVNIHGYVIQQDYREELMLNMIKLVEEFEEKTGIEVHQTGSPFIRIINAIKIKAEIGIFIGLAVLVVGFILFLFFRSFTATFFSLIVVGVGVIWSTGSMVLMGFDISILTAMIPPLIIVIGVPNCVFLLNKYHYEFKEHGNKIKALVRVITKVGNASFMTNVTTALGFATFILTDSDILVEFGIVASLNIILVFFISLIIIPSFYSYLKPPKTRHLRHLKRKWMNIIIDWMIRIVQKRRTRIYAASAFLLFLSLVGVSKIQTSGTLTDDIPKESAMYQDMKFVEKHMKGVLPLEIMIDTKKKNGVLKTSTLKRIDQLQKHLESYPDFSKTSSVVNFLKYSKQAYFNGLPEFYELPNSSEKNWILADIKNTAKQIEGDQSFGRNGLVDSNFQIARVSLLMKDIGTKRMDELRAEVMKEVEHIFPSDKYDFTMTGSSVIYYKGTKYLVNNLYQSLGLAIIIISIIMAVMFKAWRMVIVSLIPNLMPLLVTAGLMGYLGIVIKPSTILVFSIAFGISVDDTIHFLAKFKQALEVKGRSLKSATLAAIRETGVSMIYTSIILFFGFIIFMASDFGGTVALGMLVSIALLIAMIANLILLPTMLMSVDVAMEKREKTNLK
ncbi:MAG: efflux RND transporter permease subunit [Flavobacteriales bacterium]|nr:efflux RND transporter permease subunit [Flavobacteriales bacterium]